MSIALESSPRQTRSEALDSDVSVPILGIDRERSVVLPARRCAIPALGERSPERGVERRGAGRERDRLPVRLDRAARVALRQARRAQARPRAGVARVQAGGGEVLALGLGEAAGAEGCERAGAGGLELGDG